MNANGAAKKESYVGQRILRLEDPPLLKGQGRFVDDLPVRRDTLHAAVLRSPHAHARIKAIDVSEALRQPSVRAIVTGKDVWPLTRTLIVGFENPMDYRCIANDKVRFVGEPIAVVCASDRYKAEDALDFIKVEYEMLPAVVDTIVAAADGAPVLHEAAGSNVVSRRVFRHGNTDSAFAASERKASLTIEYPRNSIPPMETYAIVAEYQSHSESYDVLSNFQGPFSLHTVMAIALNVRSSKLRHRSPPNSGGSFGVKLAIFPYVVLMCVCARLAGRPVKWIEDRLEHLAAANAAPNRVTKIEAAYSDDGIVSAFRLQHWDDHGAYLRAPMPAPIYRMHGLSTNCYAIPSVDVVNHIVMTNKCPTGAVRGFGGPQLYFAIERMMHKIAVELGLDPLDVIRRNLIPQGSFPYRAPAGALIDSGDFQTTIEQAVTDGGLEELKRRRDAARREGRLYGIGYAAAVEPSQSNMGYISTLKNAAEREKAGPKDGAVASATVTVDALGSVSVVGDSTPQGQGHQTALAQIVADELGLHYRDIAVNLETDTQKDNWSLAAGNYSCRFAPAATSAVKLAAMKVREKMSRIASQTLNTPSGELVFEKGYIRSEKNPENRLEFRRVGGLAHWSPSSLPEDMAPGIRETVQWSSPALTPTTANDEINTSLAYGFGFDFCGLEIERDTGRVRIDRYVTAHDCGTILNPGLAEGQIRGSFAAGLSASLYESFNYADDGAFLSGTFADYLVGTAHEIPDVHIVHSVATPSPFTRLGAKGIGEGNQYSTPVCVANAVADALGREDITVPLVPAKVFEWIHAEEPPPPAEHAQPRSGRGLTGEGEAFFPAPPQAVWETLLDPAKMAKAIPGCEALTLAGKNTYRGAMRMGVGPVRGLFDAHVRLSDLAEHQRVTLHGQLLGSLGSSQGSARIKLVPEGQGTRLTYHYEIALAGTVAAVGSRMLSGAAKLLIAQFMKALVAQVSGPDGTGTEPDSKPSLWSRLIRGQS
jgi:2-furoyl-CoA dehydrogenase large subunit